MITTAVLAVFHVARETDDVAYDETAGYVAVAEDEQHARALGAETSGDQLADIWFVPTTTVTRIGTADSDSPAGIVLVDFNAG